MKLKFIFVFIILALLIPGAIKGAEVFNINTLGLEGTKSFYQSPTAIILKISAIVAMFIYISIFLYLERTR